MVSAAFHSASPLLVPLHSVHSAGGSQAWATVLANGWFGLGGGLKKGPQWEAAQLRCVCGEAWTIL